MILLNFSHPLTDLQLKQIDKLIDQPIQTLHEFQVQFDTQEPFVEQLRNMMHQIPLSSEAFQTEQFLVNSPALNFITAMLLAELHGRMGYFPPIIRLRPVPNSIPPQFEVAEIINLQTVRDLARMKRFGAE